MTTLADKSLLSGGDNKPPMLEKYLYDSWKSRMELYMMNRPHGRMILASLCKVHSYWPSSQWMDCTPGQVEAILETRTVICYYCKGKAHVQTLFLDVKAHRLSLLTMLLIKSDDWDALTLIVTILNLPKLASHSEFISYVQTALGEVTQS
ncbi:hypothetical protein Tco_1055599 [Tanacetum coccineum]|uniref:Uncharacterized protein n=1 Tax=Tanacetum coccineum TaxID=301880 RepID=A0ABQ5H047_9ASTR